MAPGDSASLIDTLTREQKSGGLFLFTPTNPQTTEVGFLISDFLQIYQITLILISDFLFTKSLCTSASVLWVPGGPLLRVLCPHANLETGPTILL